MRNPVRNLFLLAVAIAGLCVGYAAFSADIDELDKLGTPGQSVDAEAIKAIVRSINTEVETANADLTVVENGVSTNAGNISTNASGISTNAGGISTNTGGISTNASGISTNATNIGTNAIDISGRVVGPASSTNSKIALWSGTTGKLLKDSPVTIAFDGTYQSTVATNFEAMFVANSKSDGAGAAGTFIKVGPDGTAIKLSSGGDRIQMFDGPTRRLGLRNASSGNWTLTFPPNGGSNGQFMATNGSGVTSWADVIEVGDSYIGSSSTDLLNLGNNGSGRALRLEGSTGSIEFEIEKTGTGLWYKAMTNPEGRYVLEGIEETGHSNYGIVYPTQAATSVGQVLKTTTSGFTTKLEWSDPNQLSLETAAPTCSEGLMFYNDTSDYPCYCDSTATPKKVSDNTNCF